MGNLKFVEVNDESFEEIVLQATGPVILFFTANWCGPCRMMEMIFDLVISEYPGTTFARLDVDDSPKATQRFDILAIPTLLAFHNGVLKFRQIGAMPVKNFRQEFSDWLLPEPING